MTADPRTQTTDNAAVFPPGTFRPAPGRAHPLRMLAAHTRMEAALTLRHGEQALLTLLIPLALLIGLSTLHLGVVDSVIPRILALAVMSTAFTGQAIALGFDRRYGVIKRLSATALPRWALVSGRVLATLIVVALQAVVLGTTAVLLGWTPSVGGLLLSIPLLVLGTLTFGAAGVLIGGALRAEIVLTLANAIWFVLLLAGGLAVHPEELPGPVGTLAHFLPSGALAQSLEATLTQGAPPGLQPVLVLLVWGAVAGALAGRTTRLT
ncbi:ABC-2 type transport system permease protein [Haloactinomyces albus]|uniref:ABC-2 type transport system permease protein n=2 Tax=Haloactinomyces albus TaxID=1352928 RepID=A0AAE4CPS8_9ACTN|nr:ABC transporter permease [Haloactinomyces albus]MDR7303402.1 ABC-2 type transport system permease protein [Haloactinomyces albus]